MGQIAHINMGIWLCFYWPIHILLWPSDYLSGHSYNTEISYFKALRYLKNKKSQRNGKNLFNLRGVPVKNKQSSA